MEAPATIAEHIAAAIDGIQKQLPDPAERRPPGPDGARDFAIAITYLETARMWATRGLAKKAGVYTPTDLERDFPDLLGSQQ